MEEPELWELLSAAYFDEQQFTAALAEAQRKRILFESRYREQLEIDEAVKNTLIVSGLVDPNPPARLCDMAFTHNWLKGGF